jgi:hypothetical protein
VRSSTTAPKAASVMPRPLCAASMSMPE